MDTRKKYVAEIARFKSLDPEKGENYTDVIYNVGPANVPGLSALQSAMAKKLIDLVGQFGQFDQDEDGAQYMQKSPLLDQKISCLTCVFYAGGGECSIVQDQIDPMGLCRFNTVPESATVPSDETHAPDVL